MRGERAADRLEGVQVAEGGRGPAVGPLPDLADDRRVAREDLLGQEAPEEPRAVLEATGAGVERDARPREGAAAEVVDPVDDVRVDLALHPHGRALHERVVLEPVVGELHRVEELVRRGHLEVLERRLADSVLRLAVVVVEHAVGRDGPGGAELVGVRVVARAVAEEPDAADVGDVDVQLGPAAVVQRRRAVVERLAVAEPSRLRVPHVVEHLDRVGRSGRGSRSPGWCPPAAASRGSSGCRPSGSRAAGRRPRRSSWGPRRSPRSARLGTWERRRGGRESPSPRRARSRRGTASGREGRGG